jgi:hypothetical protein
MSFLPTLTTILHVDRMQDTSGNALSGLLAKEEGLDRFTVRRHQLSMK